ncbi:MAG: quinone-dependent dihydroorotate dehydrogenase [Crocinitomicaceae bacterium]|nr:quinone-dependent dihydroorotate dehydrogenase [Crocinitomicaceae bacterium]
MYKLIRKMLFQFDPEKVHHFTFLFLKIMLNTPIVKHFVESYYRVDSPSLNRTVLGLNFKNPVGLAAGFDKDAKLFNELPRFGFSFIEIGTVTPKPQEGNPKKRLFRIKQDSALINRMGFNNAGVDVVVKRLKKRKNKGVIIGGNIGKNKSTPNEEAYKDYEICFNELFDFVDYFVVNVSSPNTPNLRALQEKEPLKALLLHLMHLNKSKPQQKPILLKIAPDLTLEQLDDVIEIIKETKLAGVIATNTTIDRTGLTISSEEIELIGAGGVSGRPVRNKSTEIIRYLRSKMGTEVTIIGVGGIDDEFTAAEKIEAGANLIQLYTGFVYEGPSLVRRINKYLANNI